MKSKFEFKINELSDYCVGEDNNIYKKPITKINRAYSAKLIKKQKGKRYRLNNEWWSESQLRPHLIRSTKKTEIELFIDKDLPF